MAIQREYSRLILKRSTTTGTEPTEPSTNDIDSTWISTDIYEGELFLNAEDDRLWVRTANGIMELTNTGVRTTVSTVDATLTDGVTITIPNDSTFRIDYFVMAMETDSSTAYSNQYTVTYRANAGALTKVGTSADAHSEFVSASISESSTGNDLKLSVQGEVATNIDWAITYKITRIDV